MKSLKNADNWKSFASPSGEGYYTLITEDTHDVPVRLFLTPTLLSEAEDNLYSQIVNATRFPGVKFVVITPDVHYGYGVPVGCVILTDASSGAVAMGPVGYDIGCGMMSARSEVSSEQATPQRKLQFNRAVMKRVQMGTGGKSNRLGHLSEKSSTIWCVEVLNTMSRSMAPRLIVVALSATAFRWRIIGRFPSAVKANPSAAWTNLAVLGAGTTLSNCSVQKWLERSSCK